MHDGLLADAFCGGWHRDESLGCDRWARVCICCCLEGALLLVSLFSAIEILLLVAVRTWGGMIG